MIKSEKNVPLAPSENTFPSVLNGFVIDEPNVVKKVSKLKFPSNPATYELYAKGETNTMAIAIHSIANIIKLVLFLLIAPSIL